MRGVSLGLTEEDFLPCHLALNRSAVKIIYQNLNMPMNIRVSLAVLESRAGVTSTLLSGCQQALPNLRIRLYERLGQSSKIRFPVFSIFHPSSRHDSGRAMFTGGADQDLQFNFRKRFKGAVKASKFEYFTSSRKKFKHYFGGTLIKAIYDIYERNIDFSLYEAYGFKSFGIVNATERIHRDSMHSFISGSR